MIYGSVCSGIESVSVAWEHLGWKCAFLSEIESFARAVLQYRYPDTPLHGDFTTIEDGMYESIDILVGGPPCQDFSIAGLREGMKGDRGNLTLEFVRLASRLRPKYVVFENVPGILSSNGGRDFGTFIGEMVRCGYDDIARRILDAQYFGVPQRRRRVFVVGCLGTDGKRAAEILFESDGVCRHNHARRTTREVTPTLPSRSLTSGGDFDIGGGVIAHAITATGVGTCGPDDNQAQAGHLIAGTLRASASGVSRPGNGEECFLIAHTLRGEGFDASEDGTGRGTPIIPALLPFDTTSVTHPDNRANPQYGDPCHTLAAKANPPAIAFSQNQEGDIITGEIMHNLATNGNATGRNAPTIMTSRLAVRRLMPVECERLQGFPDNWTLVPYPNKRLAADGQRYCAIGNAMAVPVMRWIGEQIQKAEFAST